MVDDGESLRTGKVILMSAHERKRRRVPRPKAGNLDETLLVRVDSGQKAAINDLAAEEGLKTASYIRSVLVKLSKGWRLIPPD